jgi:hypothetical protein
VAAGSACRHVRHWPKADMLELRYRGCEARIYSAFIPLSAIDSFQNIEKVCVANRDARDETLLSSIDMRKVDWTSFQSWLPNWYLFSRM